MDLSLNENLIQRVNVGDILKRSAAKYSNNIAIVDGERRISYQECNNLVNKVANGFLSIGLKKGDRLALLSSNSLEFFLVYFACAKTGITVVPINLNLVLEEVEYIIKDACAKAVVTEEVYLEKLPDLKNNHTLNSIIVIGKESCESIPSSFTRIIEWNSLWKKQTNQEVEIEVEDRDLMQCLYTSGTTSNPKGVMSSHLAVYMNSLGTAFDLKFHEKDVSIAMLPLYHVAQINAISTPVLLAGGTTVIMKKFDPIELMELIEKEGATQIFGLPMMYRTLINHPERQKYDLSTLRLCIYAMAPMPDHDLKRAHEVFHCEFALLFGQTEMAPVATVFRPEHQLIKSGSVGNAAVNTEVGIMDHSGNILQNGEIGEIVYRGPQAMEGYLNDIEKTKEAFEYGWFHSGDYGYFDKDGILWFVDRKKDMIKTGGVNVSSIEVEKAILRHPIVENVAVVGLPHERWTEAVTAFVITKDNKRIEEEELIQFCKQYLGGFKVPKKVVFLEEFPMTSSGKIQKHIFRKNFESTFIKQTTI